MIELETQNQQKTVLDCKVEMHQEMSLLELAKPRLPRQRDLRWRHVPLKPRMPPLRRCVKIKRGGQRMPFMCEPMLASEPLMLLVLLLSIKGARLLPACVVETLKSLGRRGRERHEETVDQLKCRFRLKGNTSCMKPPRRIDVDSPSTNDDHAPETAHCRIE
jgi:hypothetical protein